MNHMHHDDLHAEAGEAKDAAEIHDEAHDVDADEHTDSAMLATVATVGVVGVGVALVEAALLPGVLLGVAAVAAPKYMPRLGAALTPIFRSTVRGVYKAAHKTREMMAEAQEQVGDIVAEMEAENDRLEQETNTSERKA
jgi:hypothetical protein